MNENCVLCGTALDPFRGPMRVLNDDVENLRRRDMEVPAPLCRPCFNKPVSAARRRFGPGFNYKAAPPADFPRDAAGTAGRTAVWTCSPFPEGEAQNLGIVSGHAVTGVGPLAYPEAEADFPERKSGHCREKPLKAEQECLSIVRRQARRRGASAVVGLAVSLTGPRTAGGMIMAGMPATAAALPGKDPQ